MSWVTDKWRTMPVEVPLPRLENHIAHMMSGFAIVAFVRDCGVAWDVVGYALLVAVVVREIIQIRRDKQTAWVALYDVLQWSFHWPFYFFHIGDYVQFTAYLLGWIGAYFFFLKHDNEWFDENVVERVQIWVGRLKK